MSEELKAVEQRMSEPFAEIRIDVRPMVVFGKPGTVGHSVGVMDESTGHGTRSSVEFAEAKARAVLKAIRAYRRKNAANLSGDQAQADGSRDD